MTFRALTCPSCGAPLPKEAVVQVVECTYCKATVAWQRTVVRAEELRRVAEAALAGPVGDGPTVSVAGTHYQVEGRIAVGTHGTVYRARRASRIGERVVLHVGHDDSAVDAYAHVRDVLARLARSTVTGAAHFTRRLPCLVASGPATEGAHALPAAAVYGLPTGFAPDLETLAGALPERLPLEHVVWIGRRVLELLDFLHRAGVVHGTVLPRHVLVHARDHAAMLVGYSNAGSVHERHALRTYVDGDTHLLPPSVLAGEPIRPADDVATLARTLRQVAPADADGAHPVIACLDRAAVADDGTATGLSARLVDAAREAFGPPRFVPLHLPPGLTD